MNKANSNKIVIINTLSTVILYAITFFSSPIFSRILGTENYGIVQVYNTWCSFFSIVVGLMTRGILPMAKVKYPDEEIEKIQSSVLFLSTVSFSAISLLILVFQSSLTPLFGLGPEYLIVLLLHSFGNYCVLFINAKFTYEMKALNNLIISVTMALSTFGLSFFLVSLCDADVLYAGRIVGMAIPYVLAGGMVLFYIFRKGRTFFCREYWRFALPLCLPLVFHSISGIVLSSSDRIMVQKMVGLSAVGIYALAYNFANIMDSIWVSLNNSWTPFMVEYIKQKEFSELKKRSENYIRLFSCLVIGFILLTPEVFRIFAAPEYWEGAIIIPVVVMSQFAIFVYAFASNFEFCYMRTDFVAFGSVIAGASNLIMNYFLIQIWGYFGAALATFLSNLILVASHVWFARRLAKENWVYSVKMFVIPVAGISVAVLLYYLCYDFWLLRWLIGALVGVYMIKNIYDQKSIF